MNSRHLKYLNFLFEMASEVEKVGGARLSAGVLIKKNLFITGSNSNRTDPWAVRFARKDKAECIHAEIQAIKNAINHYRGDRNSLQGAMLYVCRSKKENSDGTGEIVWGSAKPCSGCMEAIQLFGIKKVVYSEEGSGNFDEIII